jgi:hypothetical protein
MCWVVALCVVATAMLDDRSAQTFLSFWLADPRAALPPAAGAVLVAFGAMRWRGWRRQAHALASAIGDVCLATRDD